MTGPRKNDEKQRNALFILAHQDDEYAAFHVLEDLVKKGTSPVCIYLTNGAYGGRSSSRRNAETRAVLNGLGIPFASIHFVGEAECIADGQLHLHMESAYLATQKIVSSLPQVEEIYVLAWEGGHQDHDAAHVIGLTLAQTLHVLDDTRQFPLYNGPGLPWILFRVLAPLAQNGPVFASAIPWRKRLLYAFRCLSYPSQIRTWIGLFPFVLADLLIVGVQRLQPVSLERVRERPHRGLLLYERRGFLSYARFREAVTPFMDRHLASADGRGNKAPV